jgi:DNA ligase-1
MLGKTFKGLTDEMLAWQTEQLLRIEAARDSYTVYVEPKLVVEIAFNEIQVSPTYASGLALRFARVKRYRPDKAAGDADTFETVKRLAGATV